MNIKDLVNDKYICFGSDSNELIKKLDNEFIGFIKGYNYTEVHIPALINETVIKKCGYLEKMPGTLTSVSYNSDISNNEINSLPKYYLTPAACIHIYPMLQDLIIENDQIITTKARVYRHEKEYNGGTRLWDFTVREIVAIGNQDFVSKFLNDLKEKSLNFALKYSDTANLVNSNDNFYPSRQNLMMEKIQKSNNLKTELNVTINNNIIALSSFNLHGNHFSKTFNFDNNGKVVTGCVGFGLERWIKFINSTLIEGEKNN